MRVTMFVMGMVLAGLITAACGKKTAPIPPEDVPPAKQERSNTSSRGYAVHSFQV